MGAIAGSWAGLHGPGEKNNRKDWSVGPWTVLGAQGAEQGPGAEGCRPPLQVPSPTGKTAGAQAGAWGRNFLSRWVGLPWGQAPIPEGLMQGEWSGCPLPGRSPYGEGGASEVLGSRPHWASIPKNRGHPPPRETPGHRLLYRDGCLDRPSLPESTSERQAPVNLQPGAGPAGAALQPEALLCDPHPKAFQRLCTSPREPWHCPAPLLPPPWSDGHGAGRGACLASAPRHSLHLIWLFILNG